MRRLLLVPAVLAAATFVPATPANATPCEVKIKDTCVSVCLTANFVYRTVTGEDLFGCG